MLTRFTWLSILLAVLPATACGESLQFRATGNDLTEAGALQADGLLGRLVLRTKCRMDYSQVFFVRQRVATAHGTRTRCRAILGGMIQFNKVNGSGLVSDQLLNGPTFGFSLDYTKALRWGKTTYTLSSLADSSSKFQAKEGLLRELWGRHYDELFEGTKREQKQKANAFSLAIYEILNETGDSLNVKSGPGFWVKQYSWQKISGVLDLANQWLSSLDGTGPQGEIWVATVQTNGKYFQPILVGLPPAVSVPEPGCMTALAGLVLSLVGAGLMRRWRQP